MSIHECGCAWLDVEKKAKDESRIAGKDIQRIKDVISVFTGVARCFEVFKE
ncbi:hypothetical protein [Photobacterium leiognathi]|uniref:hypothetical protein n=1 Tax=Photobacterium leiognathi TaxID=553611 RepID=UPI001E5E6818|nr:hypothetical protein [Photobacterium leiognathi]